MMPKGQPIRSSYAALTQLLRTPPRLPATNHITRADPSTHALPAPPRAMAPGRTRPDKHAMAAERLRAHRRRISVLRRRIIAIAVAIFLATTGGILIQLVTGNDPALVSSAARKAAATST